MLKQLSITAILFTIMALLNSAIAGNNMATAAQPAIADVEVTLSSRSPKCVSESPHPRPPHRGRFFDGWRSKAIRRDRRLPVRGDVFLIRTPCGRAEARPYGKNLPVKAPGPRPCTG